MTYTLTKLHTGNKKFKVITPNGKTIYFGASGYTDYTISKNLQQRERYIARHKKNENWNNLNSAGAWSRWILWEKPTIKGAITHMKKKFSIQIKYV